MKKTKLKSLTLHPVIEPQPSFDSTFSWKIAKFRVSCKTMLEFGMCTLYSIPKVNKIKIGFNPFELLQNLEL
jgi:hypothetical protein